KTEAVLLPVFSQMLAQGDRPGISLLYITPLRALNRDIVERVEMWATRLGFIVQVRHGDTETKVRRRQATHPPDILITTPETLQAILPGSRMRNHLRCIRHVVVDEIHQLIGAKRGVQLAVGLERLTKLVNGNFQRIGLSATVNDPARMARFIGGTARSVEIVEVIMPKEYRFKVEHPEPTDRDFDLAEKLHSTPEAAARMRRILELVKSHDSTIIFVNSRTNAELLGHKLSQLTSDIAVHHGSLSKEERRRIEDEFKAGTLRAIVCTSTMEVGIDIGQVDLVIQYLSPRRVSSLIQRVGRSGHRLGLVSEGVIITAFPEDSAESIAALQRAGKGFLEPIPIHENALDVLAHQTAGILMENREASVTEVMNQLKRTYPYRNLTKTQFIDVIEQLQELREVSFDGETLRKTGRTRDYYFRNLSMIPDERRYPIVDVLSDRTIGSLGDEFMTFSARIGLNFICRGQPWRIVQIEDETGIVYVVPSDDQLAAIPGWDGEMPSISYELAQDVGKLRETIGRALDSNSVEAAINHLSRSLQVEKPVLTKLVEEVAECLHETRLLPTHNRILVEAFDRYLIIHACFGETVNRTLGSIFDTVLSDQELIQGWWNDAYRILVEAPSEVTAENLTKASKLLFTLSKNAVDAAFQDFVKSHFPFTYRMKFIAERFGALPRGKTISMERSAQLPTRFRDTPIYDEALREALTESVDLQRAHDILKRTRNGTIDVHTLLRIEKPTSLAYTILAKHSDVAELMAPESVVLGNIERMRQSTEARSVQLQCLSCGQLQKRIRVRNLPEQPVCSECGSRLLTRLHPRQQPEALRSLFRRRKKGGSLTAAELDEMSRARRTADLILAYGRNAVVATLTRGVGPETASRILGRMHPTEEALYLDLLKAKITYLRTKPYWAEKKRDQTP
ncbi:MAG: DEAD/DEAH box helicase, partial [Candidatus Bathyarchaeota archaeon]